MEKGTCPVCSGTKEVLLTEEDKKWSWNKDKTHCACTNCGGQYMFGRATGQVSMDFGGQPCVHEYAGQNAGRCLTEYTCKFCGDRHQIDSGD